MNCLVLDPKTVIVEASEVYQQEMDKARHERVIPVDLRGAYASAAASHCPRPTSTARASASTHFPNRVADPTLVRPGDVERLVA